VSRWIKVTLVVLVGVVALLALNAVTVTNSTKDAERNVEGAELVETSNGALQVLEQGDPAASPVVLLHGAAGSLRWFESVVPLLAERHRVISVDLLGHGGSDKPSTGYEISDQANAVAEALAKRDVVGATVVGHSLGGTVAVALAEQSPELASRLVILDQAPNDSYEQNSADSAVLSAPLIGPAIWRLSQIGPTSAVRDQYEIAFAPGFNIASGFENPDQVVDDLRAMTYTSFNEPLEAEGDYTDLRSLDERLRAIEVPLLVVFGVEDQVYGAEESLAPYESVAGVQTQLLEGVGHTPNVEAPEETAALIEAFIARTAAAERAARKAEAARQAKKVEARKAARAEAREKREKRQAAKKEQGKGDAGK
jgi:pimeloyl-ACP methyl ester carboxylesterase